LADVGLLVARVVHEDERVALAVEELHLPLLDVGGLELLAGADVPFDDRAREQVLEAGPREGGPLAGLDELELDDGVGVAVHEDLQPLSDLAGIVHSANFYRAGGQAVNVLAGAPPRSLVSNSPCRTSAGLAKTSRSS